MKIRSDVKSGAACYTVQSGDNLSFIAKRFYGTEGADAVNKIYYSNLQTIGPNPNLIRPGQKLYIPD
jgi:nucleoid-associated protein YgaU